MTEKDATQRTPCGGYEVPFELPEKFNSKERLAQRLACRICPGEDQFG